MNPLLSLSFAPPPRTLAAAIAAGLLAAGCAAPLQLPAPLDIPPRNAASSATTAPDAQSRDLAVTANPAPPTLADKPQPPAPVTAPAGTAGTADVTLNFDQLPLPAFIQTVYATVLKKNISIDPAIMMRRDLVTLRSGKPLTAADAESSTRTLLKTYGIAVQDVGGLVRIVPDNSNTGYLPEIRRGRAQPDTPLPLRPVFQLVELQAVRPTELISYLRTLFGEKVRYIEDPARNSLLLAGNGDDVQATLEAIQVLDQPLFKARNSVRLSPTIWSAEELAKRLTEILTQEGYSVGTATPGGVQFPITLLPIPGLNSIVVFTPSKQVSDHIVEWAKVLDRPAERTAGRNYFSYQVRNTDAARLQETVQQLLSSTPPRPAGAATAGTAAANTASANNVVVDKATNTILFRASGEEYTDIVRLLRDLDRAARQVLIEVTVAQVKLNDTTTIGVDWIFQRLNGSGLNVTALGGNTGGVSAPTISNITGLVVSQLDGANMPRAILSALATDDRGQILSSPRVLARNGETANIQVGQSVPVLTSQQSSSATGGNGLISTVQYRDTGVILRIKPVIHSSDQVDLEIVQEVSSVDESAKGGIVSPTFSKRALDTKLTLKHGSTYVLGGLIETSTTKTNSGVPFLKDIPILGIPFKKSTDSVNRTEVIMMITPYIMSDDGEARAISDAFRRQLGAWAQEQKSGK